MFFQMKSFISLCVVLIPSSIMAITILSLAGRGLIFSGMLICSKNQLPFVEPSCAKTDESTIATTNKIKINLYILVLYINYVKKRGPL